MIRKQNALKINGLGVLIRCLRNSSERHSANYSSIAYGINRTVPSPVIRSPDLEFAHESIKPTCPNLY